MTEPLRACVILQHLLCFVGLLGSVGERPRRRYHDVPTGVLDRVHGDVVDAGLPGVGESERYRGSRDPVQPSGSRADKGVEVRRRWIGREIRIEAAGGGGQLGQVESVRCAGAVLPVDLKGVGQAEVAMQLEAVSDSQLAAGSGEEDAAATG